MTWDDSEVRAVTARIAAGYDLVQYNPNGPGNPGLDLKYLLGVASLYGEFPPRRL